VTAKRPFLEITPETRVGALLDAYPMLEDQLFTLSPAFQKLRNPLLRKTVAKVTTLRQASRVGGVSLAEMITTLRRAAGQTEIPVEEGEAPDGKVPDWFSDALITGTLDGRPLIESGERPMETVLAALEKLGEGEVYELITPFVPAPLADLARRKGFEVWHRRPESELVRTYFGRPPRRAFEV